MKLVKESLFEFERGVDPKKALGLGLDKYSIIVDKVLEENDYGDLINITNNIDKVTEGIKNETVLIQFTVNNYGLVRLPISLIRNYYKNQYKYLKVNTHYFQL